MTELVEFTLLTLTSLLTVVNPIGAIPMYSAVSAGVPKQQAKSLATKAGIWAAIFMISFAFAGKFVFDFFAISVNSLKIVGGILFFVMGYDMLQGHANRFKYDSEEVAEDHVPFDNDAAITPLALPVICGPGAITVSIVSMQSAQTIEMKLSVVAVIIFVAAITGLTLRTSRQVLGFIGESGAKVLMRILGLIVMMIAVEYVLAGLTAIVTRLLAT